MFSPVREISLFHYARKESREILTSHQNKDGGHERSSTIYSCLRNIALSDLKWLFRHFLAIFCKKIEGKVLSPGVY